MSQGANLPFGSRITTGGVGGDGVTVRFGNGAVLNIGLSSSVLINADQIILESGTLQYVSGNGGITNLAAPGQTIALLGTDVDLITDGGKTVLRVRDGAANFTDESGTTHLNTEVIAESRLNDGVPPQIIAPNSADAQSHSHDIHDRIHLVLPIRDTSKSAAYSYGNTVITGTALIGSTLTFTVPVTKTIIVSGSPQLLFTFRGQNRLANYSGGSGTDRLTFTYQITLADAGLSGITAQELQKNGGSLMGVNGAPMVLSLNGTYSGTVPSDTTPDAFTFIDQTNVASSIQVTSNSVTISGIDTPSPISITGDGTPEYRINGGSWTSAAGTIDNGDTLELRLTSAVTGGVMSSVTVNVGGVTDQWDVTTETDTTPDAFTFTDQTNVASSTQITSNSVTIAGMNVSVPISISGDGSPEYRMNGGAWTNGAGTINNGNTLELRLMSSASGAVTSSVTINVGGVTDQWDVTTIDPYTYSWATGAYGSCSASCGGGTQTRSVYCERSDGASVADSFCGGGKPATSQSCNTQACCAANVGQVCGTKPGYCVYACVLACGGCTGGWANADSGTWQCKGSGSWNCAPPPPQNMYIQCDGSCQ